MFFTRGVTLEKWVSSGLFEREVLIYHSHLKSKYFNKIYWFTYGYNDIKVAEDLYSKNKLSKKIEIVPYTSWLKIFGWRSSLLYSILMPFLHFKKISDCSLLKTNQMDGSFSPLIFNLFSRRPLYVRTGYTLSRILNKIKSRYSLIRILGSINEYFAFKYSSVSSVTSDYDKNYIIKKFGVKVKPPLVIGNYIDVNKFSPAQVSTLSENSILFIGRLSPEKNLENAILASKKAGLTLDIIGQGPELDKLKLLVKKSKSKVRWLGLFNNDELPQILNKYRYFILPSYWEGLPKSLLEAMSTGLICIGNNTTGINEIIEDNISGFLSKSSDSNSIYDAIIRAKRCNHKKISKSARLTIQNKYSLEAIVKLEQSIFDELLN